ncbi:MAG: lactate utilization protein [Deltaproteobacteria bacterium]|nr:lactate utilization protein [Deltaproteobacteria bacterium]
MSTSKTRILGRLRQQGHLQSRVIPGAAASDAQWLALQPPLGDLSQRFQREAQAVGAEILPVPDWDALPNRIPPWLAEVGVKTVLIGDEPRLAPLRKSLQTHPGLSTQVWDKPLEDQKALVFSTDCGITTTLGGLAETGTLILAPTPEEPRLLSLAPPIHLAVLEKSRLMGRLSEFVRQGVYQRERPTNLVLITGPSRTADIELTLVLGVHGPRRLLVALVG